MVWVLPALSVAVAVKEKVPTPLALPPVTVSLQPLASMPEKPSVAVHDAAGTPPRVYTPPLAMPLMAMAGLSVSMLIGLTVVVATLSALSVAVPLTDWLAPLVLSVTPLLTAVAPVPVTPVQVWIPDCTAPASAQVNFTVTGALYQPLAFGPVVAAPVMVGAVLSSLTVSASLPRLVATSSAWALMACAMVSVPHSASQTKVLLSGVVTVPPAGVPVASGAPHLTVVLSTPEPRSSSNAVNFTSTLALVQPAALSFGVVTFLMVGAMLSNLIE